MLIPSALDGFFEELILKRGSFFFWGEGVGHETQEGFEKGHELVESGLVCDVGEGVEGHGVFWGEDDVLAFHDVAKAGIGSADVDDSDDAAAGEHVVSEFVGEEGFTGAGGGGDDEVVVCGGLEDVKGDDLTGS